MSILNKAGEVVKEFDMAAHGIVTPHSNEAINKIASNTAVQKAIGIMDKPIEMLSKEGVVKDRLQAIADDKLKYDTRDYLRMGLGTYAAASVAGRAISGGGVYRDSHGNFDVVGIPII